MGQKYLQAGYCVIKKQIYIEECQQRYKIFQIKNYNVTSLYQRISYLLIDLEKKL